MKTIRYLRPMTEYFIPKITQESTLFRQVFPKLLWNRWRSWKKIRSLIFRTCVFWKSEKVQKNWKKMPLKTVSIWKKFIFRTVWQRSHMKKALAMFTKLLADARITLSYMHLPEVPAKLMRKRKGWPAKIQKNSFLQITARSTHCWKRFLRISASIRPTVSTA